MAGVEFAKYGGGAFGEMSCHFDNELRADERITHSNQTINQELTHNNYYLGATSYREIVERTEALISETDAKNPPKRVRKDRKVSFSLEVPCPPELEGTDQEDIFYEKAFEMYKKYLPGLTGAVIHKDEKHEYYDSKKESFCISRNHMHALGACLTEDGRINCHDLIDTEMCQRVNDDIQELCLKEWGISYQTGEGRQGEKKTVEQLKSESEVALQEKLAKENLEVVVSMRAEKETLQKEKKTLQGEIEDLALIKEMDTREVVALDKEVTEKQANVSLLQAQIGDLQGQVEETTNNLENLQNELKKKASLVEKLDDALKNLFTRFNNAFVRMQKIFDHWLENDQKIYTELVAKADKPIKKANTSMDILMKHTKGIVFGSAKITSEVTKEVDEARKDLASATQEMEEIEEEYGDYE